MNADSQRDRAKQRPLGAIRTMRSACDDAERIVVLNGAAEAAQGVLKALAWGLANASSGIETAMAALEDAHVIAAMETAEKKAGQQ